MDMRPNKYSDLNKNHDLNKFRKEIDKIDSEIVLLLSKRMKVSKRIGLLKKCNEQKIIDLKRENEITLRIKKFAKKNDVAEELVLDLFKKIILYSKKAQK